MPDITMCLNENCPISANCYRKQAKPKEYQSYSIFKYHIDENGYPHCEDFLAYAKVEGKRR